MPHSPRGAARIQVLAHASGNPLALIELGRAIAAELNQSERQTFHLLERGLLPAGKVGEKWVGSRTALRAHMLKITGGALDVA